MSKTLMSVHWIPSHRGPEDRERFARWNPPFVKILTNDSKIPYLEDVPAGSEVVVRNHPMSEMDGHRGFLDLADAVRVGRAHADLCRDMANYALSVGFDTNRLIFETINEPEVWQPAETPEKIAAYCESFLNAMHRYGLRSCVLNLGVGWPGNNGVQDAPPIWTPFLPVFKALWKGDFVGLHEYWGYNGPQENWRWWGGRFLQCPYNAPFLITECGIDGGVCNVPHGGWHDLTEPNRAERYVNELAWYATECAKDGRVKGIFPFTYDIGSRDWERFDIRDSSFMDALFRYLDRLVDVTPPPPPTRDPLPEDESVTDVPGLTEKVTWWHEEAVRCLESGNRNRAEAIIRSNMKLMYRLRMAVAMANREVKVAVPKPPIRDMISVLARNGDYGPRTRPIDRLVIHHSVGNGMLPPGVIATWKVAENWAGFPYHYYITADGTIYLCQPHTSRAAHVGSDNDHCLGICIAGNFMDGREPTPKQMEATAALCAWLVQELKLKPEDIIGHRELGGTVCPGSGFLNGWKTVLLGKVHTVQA